METHFGKFGNITAFAFNSTQITFRHIFACICVLCLRSFIQLLMFVGLVAWLCLFVWVFRSFVKHEVLWKYMLFSCLWVSVETHFGGNLFYVCFCCQKWVSVETHFVSSVSRLCRKWISEETHFCSNVSRFRQKWVCVETHLFSNVLPKLSFRGNTFLGNVLRFCQKWVSVETHLFRMCHASAKNEFPWKLICFECFAFSPKIVSPWKLIVFECFAFLSNMSFRGNSFVSNVSHFAKNAFPCKLTRFECFVFLPNMSFRGVHDLGKVLCSWRSIPILGGIIGRDIEGNNEADNCA